MDMVKALAQSRKAWVLLIAIVAVVGLTAMKMIDGAQALDFVKWLVVAWFGAVAIEDGAQKLMVPPSGTTVVNNAAPPAPPAPEEKKP